MEKKNCCNKNNVVTLTYLQYNAAIKAENERKDHYAQMTHEAIKQALESINSLEVQSSKNIEHVAKAKKKLESASKYVDEATKIIPIELDKVCPSKLPVMRVLLDHTKALCECAKQCELETLEDTIALLCDKADTLIEQTIT